MGYQLSDFEACPRCTLQDHPGRLTLEDSFIAGVEVWLKFIKCMNCGWRYELKPTRRRKVMVITK